VLFLFCTLHHLLSHCLTLAVHEFFIYKYVFRVAGIDRTYIDYIFLSSANEFLLLHTQFVDSLQQLLQRDKLGHVINIR
jgi:hypothetical protein